jgi:sugar lactone lactonase YvrE
MLRLIRSIFPLLLPTLVAAQNVVTPVTGGDWIFPAGPLPAVTAPLGAVTGLAIAPNGDLLVADGDNAIVLRVDATGTTTVVAGNGIVGYSGDGGPATSASLYHPAAVAADAQGNIYVSDSGGASTAGITCYVRKISPSGTISTVAHCDQANIYTTPQLALDPSGNLFLIVPAHVYRLLPDSAVQLMAGSASGCGVTPCLPPPPVPANTPALSARFNYLASGAFDAAGNLYLSDDETGTLYKLSSAGTITTVATHVAAQALVADGDGNLYAADLNQSNSIKRITISTGIATVLAGDGTRNYSGDGGPATSAGFDVLSGLAVDPTGRIYVADGFRVRAFQPGGVIKLIAGNGRYVSSPDGVPALGALIYLPGGVATDASGNIYFGEYAGRIRRISGGILSTVAGNSTSGISGDGGPALNASIGRPQAIAIDTSGAIYFTEWNTGAIRKIGTDGIIQSLPKPGSAIGSSLYPGIAVDRSGNVYVTSAESIVYRISPSGSVSRYAGTGDSGYNGDSIPAVRAQLNFPQGLAMDAGGNLYIADRYNNRIRKVTPDGVISTVGAINSSVAFVAIDGSGDLFASDDQNQIWRLSNGAFVPWSRGTGPYNMGIAADNSGNVYIANSIQPPWTGSPIYSILEVLATPPVLTAAPAQLTFQGVAGGPATAPQAVNFTGVSGLQFTLNAIPSWLTASAPSGGAAPASISFIANPAGLAPGTYTALVSISAPGAIVTASAISLKFTVSSPAPALVAPNGGLSFTLAQGSDPVQQPLLLANTGSGSITCTASVSGEGWLSVSGTVTLGAGASAPLVVTVNPGGLAAGVYTGRIVVASSDGSQHMEAPVTVTILGAAPALILSQSGLSFTAVAGVAPVPSESFWIINKSGPPVAWTAAVSSASGNWLSVLPASGIVSASPDGASQVTVSVTTDGLAPGIYEGQIAVSGGGQTASVVVVLNVLPAGSTPPPLVRPAGLLFAAAAGTDSGSQQITLTNLTGHPVSYISGRTPDSSPWFAALPSAASIPPGQSQAITVQTNASALPPGLAQGALTLLFDDGTIETVSILRLTFTGAETTGTADARPRNITTGCTPTTLYGAFTTLPDGSSVTPGQPTTIGAVVADDCGAPVEAGDIQVVFSDGEKPLSLNATGGGYWEASWVPPGTAGSITLQLTPGSGASIAQLNLNPAGSATAMPAIDRGGVVSAADPLPMAPLARGGLIAIYGAGLADAPLRAGVTPLPTTLGGVQVLLGGEPLPLLYVSPGQIDAALSYDAPVGIPLPVVVSNGSRQSPAEMVLIATAQPAAFLLPQFGPTQAAAAGPGGLATPRQPAIILLSMQRDSVPSRPTSQPAASPHSTPSTGPLIRFPYPSVASLPWLSLRVSLRGRSANTRSTWWSPPEFQRATRRRW